MNPSRKGVPSIDLTIPLVAMPTGDENIWRLVKNIQSWSNTVKFETYEAAIGRTNGVDLQRMHDVGRLIEASADLIFEKLRVLDKNITWDC